MSLTEQQRETAKAAGVIALVGGITAGLIVGVLLYASTKAGKSRAHTYRASAGLRR